MTRPVRIIGLSGSLRTGSFNAQLLRAAAKAAPEGAEFVVRTIRGIPLYDGDIETQEGVPEPVETLKNEVAAADGLFLVTPEYNTSIPGVFKNAIDWMSRPPEDSARVFRGKPVAFIGASPSGFGTILSQEAWLPVFRTLGVEPWFGGRLMVARAHQVFAPDDGAILDAKIEQALTTYVAGFVDHLRSRRSD